MRLTTTVRREQIVRAVQELLAAEGLSGVSAARVAERVGIVPSALYRHFPSLEAMVLAAVDDIRNRSAGYISDCLLAGHGPLETLRMLLDYSAGLLPVLQIMPRLIFSSTPCESTFANYVRAMQQQHLETLNGLVRQAQAAGQIRRDHQPDVIALIYWGITLQCFMRWIATRGEFDVAGHIKAAWELFLDMIEPAAAGAAQRAKRPGGRAKQ